ncbi:MAG TPA: cytidylate kinase family protein [Bacteroidales bacterium]|mgnify:CR=1 FL=1|nr:cytidylate kinase family protein [Bacteroidales bacterium]HNZ42341.1 cytidylate kinase family protein [Bacteroidales bacterium]HOH83142.1 cytidylate kinase family protein [Bacteroidales bacterium]HPB24819.1 cytidylate kinase family protein [Bacteroidales bacterium]HPI29729.1 cytidylate kinase family protein [Bacteroidales bacterium]
MGNILLQYMVNRFNAGAEGIKPPVANLPFITLSREYGCPAQDVAVMLVDRLNNANEKTKNLPPWTKLSKEILLAASQELHVDPSRIYKIFNDEKRGAIDEILNAFSEKYYYSDLKILKTLDKIILDFATRGNVVIIGRGGMAVTRHLSAGVHVRLFAPIEWRVKKLIESGACTTIEAAKKLSNQIDFKRNVLLKSKSKSDNYEDDFDVFYNCKYLGAEDISESIIQLMKLKKLL